MDLFNRKKVAALQSDLAIATAQLKATTKELDDLQTGIVKSYDELTEYFRPRYKNKYFKVELTQESDDVSGNGIIYMQVLDVEYKAGFILLTINEGTNNDEDVSLLEIMPTELKLLKVITKKEFLNKGGQE